MPDEPLTATFVVRCRPHLWGTCSVIHGWLVGTTPFCDPNAGAATAGKLSAFNGKNAAGSGKFCVGYIGLGDVGAIQQVKLTFPAGVLQVAAASTDFGTVTVGATSAEKVVTLSNSGNASLTIDTLTLATSPFARTATGTCGNSLPRTLAVGESCTLSYNFTPTAPGSALQTFTMQATGGGDSGFGLVGIGSDTAFKNSFKVAAP